MVCVAEEVGWSRLSVLPEQGVGTGTMWSLLVPLEGTVSTEHPPAITEKPLNKAQRNLLCTQEQFHYGMEILQGTSDPLKKNKIK